MIKILVINPGSTSTKIAVYEDEKQVFLENLEHSAAELAALGGTFDQIPFRADAISAALAKAGIPEQFDCVMGRGGAARGLKAGAYIVNEALEESLRTAPLFDHPSNIGAELSKVFADRCGADAYIYDAVSAEVLIPEAKITGVKGHERNSLCHILNARATAMRYAKEQGGRYEDFNLVVMHLGGGCTVSAHQHGQIIDDVRDDGGPFSPTRAGSIDFMDAVDMCFSGEYSYEDMKKIVRGNAGLVALLGTNDAREVEKRIAAGDEYAKLVYDAMGYNLAKAAASMLACFTEKADAVIITGGMAHSKMLTSYIASHLQHLAPVVIMPGENEMESLAFGGLRILRGEEIANYI